MDQLPEIQIRIANTGDAVTIALLGRITFSEAFGDLFRNYDDLQKYYHKTFSVQKIRTSLQKDQNIYWLALVDELPVGYAKLKLESGTPFLDIESVCQLQKIYVLKRFSFTKDRTCFADKAARKS